MATQTDWCLGTSQLLRKIHVLKSPAALGKLSRGFSISISAQGWLHRTAGESLTVPWLSAEGHGDRGGGRNPSFPKEKEQAGTQINLEQLGGSLLKDLDTALSACSGKPMPGTFNYTNQLAE